MSCVTQESCVSGKFKRMNYFHGMLLTEQDFRDEQTYIREKLKLHNQLHGDGVVWGLRLVKDCFKIDPKTTITKIFIEGGLALDCAGNEIVVCEDYLVPLDEKVDELRKRGLLKRMEECRPPIYKGPKLFIGIRYCECKFMPAEQYTSECADDRLRPQFSRVREGFEVRLFTEEELPGCAKHKGAMPATGCSQSCPECHGLHPCGEDELFIILGSVEDYDTSVENPDHKDAKITLCENHPPTPSYLRMSRRWEAQKQGALEAVLKEAKWIDVSVLLGQEVQGIKERLEKMGLLLGEIYVPGKVGNPQAFLEKAKCAQPWAAPRSKIDIVTDDSNECVTFLLVNPPA